MGRSLGPAFGVAQDPTGPKRVDQDRSIKSRVICDDELDSIDAMAPAPDGLQESRARVSFDDFLRIRSSEREH